MARAAPRMKPRPRRPRPRRDWMVSCAAWRRRGGFESYNDAPRNELFLLRCEFMVSGVESDYRTDRQTDRPHKHHQATSLEAHQTTHPTPSPADCRHAARPAAPAPGRVALTDRPRRRPMRIDLNTQWTHPCHPTRAIRCSQPARQRTRKSPRATHATRTAAMIRGAVPARPPGAPVDIAIEVRAKATSSAGAPVDLHLRVPSRRGCAEIGLAARPAADSSV